MVSIKPHRVVAKFTLGALDNEENLNPARQPSSAATEIRSFNVPISEAEPRIVEIEIAEVETEPCVFRAFKQLVGLMGLDREEGKV